MSRNVGFLVETVLWLIKVSRQGVYKRGGTFRVTKGGRVSLPCALTLNRYQVERGPKGGSRGIEGWAPARSLFVAYRGKASDRSRINSARLTPLPARSLGGLMKVGKIPSPLRSPHASGRSPSHLELTTTLEIRFCLLSTLSIAALLPSPISQILRIPRYYASARLRDRGLALTNRTY